MIISIVQYRQIDLFSNKYYLDADNLRPKRSLLSTNFTWLNPNNSERATVFSDIADVLKWIEFIHKHVKHLASVSVEYPRGE